MNQLLPHIETLLMEHECVIVPNFGAFILQHQSAKIKGGIILPPKTIITFNQSLTADDRLLTSRLVKSMGIRFPQAKRFIQEQVEQLLAELEQYELEEREDKTVCLGRLGQIQFVDGDKNHLLFTPYACKFLPDNLGLPTTPLRPKQFETNQTTKAEQNHQSENTTDKITFTLKRRTLRQVAACLLFMILWAIPQNNHEALQKDYASIVPVNFYMIIEQQLEQNRIAQQVAAEEEAIEQEDQITLNQQDAPFHLIIASLTTEKQAKTYIEKLKSMDIVDAYIIKCAADKYRVSIASFTSKKEALNRMNTLRAETSFTQSWVYCKN